MKEKLISWIPAVMMAAMLGVTGIMKLMMTPDAGRIFADMGGTPALLFAGAAELAAAVLLLVPQVRLYGALLAAGTIAAHLFVLPDESMVPVPVILLLLSGFLLYWHRSEAPYGFSLWLRGF